jgi:hypothetical protein
MTDQQHPIIVPPLELVQQWLSEFYGSPTAPGESTLHVANRAAQWGVDTELEACIDWISVYQGLEHPELLIELLRAARRPKPPSLKEQALAVLEEAPGPDYPRAMTVLDSEQHALIRRALEALPND